MTLPPEIQQQIDAAMAELRKEVEGQAARLLERYAVDDVYVEVCRTFGPGIRVSSRTFDAEYQKMFNLAFDHLTPIVKGNP